MLQIVYNVTQKLLEYADPLTMQLLVFGLVGYLYL